MEYLVDDGTLEELTDNEVRELIKEYLETGNEEIRNRVTYSYSKHIYRIAEGMVRGSLTVDDLFQEGIVTLWKAVPFFDVDSPSPCLAFFNKVIISGMAKLYNAREMNGYLFQETVYNEKYIRAYEELTYVLGAVPTLADYADYVGKKPQDILRVYQGLAKMDSIEEREEEILNIPSEENLEEQVVNKIYYKEVFRRVLKYLTDRELYVYMNHKDWGFNNPRIREDIAKSLKVSRLRIEQLEKKAEEKIRLMDKYYLKGNKRSLASVLYWIFRDDLEELDKLMANLDEEEKELLERRYSADLKEVISDDFSLQEIDTIYDQIIPKLMANNALKLNMKKPGI